MSNYLNNNNINLGNGSVYCYTSEYQETPLFYLPHQCDDWEIGDIDDAKEFVKDLQKTIDELETILAESEQHNE